MTTDTTSVFGFKEKTAAAFAYLGFFITGIIVLIMEKNNKTVRFAALQSTVFFFFIFALSGALTFVFGWLPIIGWLASIVVHLIRIIGGVVWVYLTIMAYSGKMVKLGFLGDLCWEQVNKK